MHNPPLILIADDEAEMREILSTKLTKSGFWVAQAVNGDEAVQKAKELKPDLIMLDINMPQANGTEVLIAIREEAELKDTKVIFLTSLTNPWPLVKTGNPDFARELGATDFINKSEDLDVVVSKVQQAFKVNGSDAADPQKTVQQTKP